MCVGCFSEDEVFAVVALDLLAPFISQQVAEVSLPPLNVRKWLIRC